eukprot:scaffold13048_cov68-Phaeocystis_antarctica.AAC.2
MAGRDLVAKDRSLFGKKSSDPYVVIMCGKRTLGTTKVVDKSLNPVWNQTFKLNLDAKAAARLESTELVFATPFSIRTLTLTLTLTVTLPLTLTLP